MPKTYKLRDWNAKALDAQGHILLETQVIAPTRLFARWAALDVFRKKIYAIGHTYADIAKLTLSAVREA